MQDNMKDVKPVCLLSKMEEESWLWQSRLGHVNFQVMTLMSNNEMAYGLQKLIQPKEVCKGRLLSKQARKSFPSQTNFTAKVPLELIHGDSCGPGIFCY